MTSSDLRRVTLSNTANVIYIFGTMLLGRMMLWFYELVHSPVNNADRFFC